MLSFAHIAEDCLHQLDAPRAITLELRRNLLMVVLSVGMLSVKKKKKTKAKAKKKNLIKRKGTIRPMMMPYPNGYMF